MIIEVSFTTNLFHRGRPRTQSLIWTFFINMPKKKGRQKLNSCQYLEHFDRKNYLVRCVTTL